MPKPNYQRDKRQRDLARQRKQEEKRQKKAMKGSGVNNSPESPETAETATPDALESVVSAEMPTPQQD